MIKKAIRFAIEFHKDQKRKGTDFPYIEHPIHVGMLLAEAKQKEEVVAAGILHDTLEDTEATEEIIEEQFGGEVLALIKGASEPDRDLSWEERKAHTAKFLTDAPKEVQIIGLCDKLSNIMDMEADYDEFGDDLWNRFNAGYEDQKGYYNSLVKAFKSLEEIGLYKDFANRVGRFFSK